MQGTSATKEMEQSKQPAKRAKLLRNHWGNATEAEILQRQQQLRQQQLAGPPDYHSIEKTKAAAQLAGTQFCQTTSTRSHVRYFRCSQTAILGLIENLAVIAHNQYCRL